MLFVTLKLKPVPAITANGSEPRLADLVSSSGKLLLANSLLVASEAVLLSKVLTPLLPDNLVAEGVLAPEGVALAAAGARLAVGARPAAGAVLAAVEELLDAELLDAELVEAELADAELLNAELVDGELVDAGALATVAVLTMELSTKVR